MRQFYLASVAVIAAATGASAAEYYVVRNTTANTCMVSDTQPTGATLTALGNTQGYASRADADAALSAAPECKTASAASPSINATAAAPAAPAMNTTAASGTINAAGGTQANVMMTVPSDSASMKRYADQNVYDPTGAKVGEITDALIHDGNRIDAFVVSVGGFLGLGEKDVLVPVKSVNFTMKDGKTPWLTISATKDELKSAPGVQLDSSKTTWVQRP